MSWKVGTTPCLPSAVADKRQPMRPRDNDLVGRQRRSQVVGDRLHDHALARRQRAQFDEMLVLEEAARRPRRGDDHQTVADLRVAQMVDGARPVERDDDVGAVAAGRGCAAIVKGCGGRTIVSATVTVQVAPSATALTRRGRSSLMRRIASPSAPRVRLACWMPCGRAAERGDDRSSPCVSNTSHSMSARRNTAAGVGAAKGRTSFSLSPDCCTADRHRRVGIDRQGRHDRLRRRDVLDWRSARPAGPARLSAYLEPERELDLQVEREPRAPLRPRSAAGDGGAGLATAADCAIGAGSAAPLAANGVRRVDGQRRWRRRLGGFAALPGRASAARRCRRYRPSARRPRGRCGRPGVPLSSEGHAVDASKSVSPSTELRVDGMLRLGVGEIPADLPVEAQRDLVRRLVRRRRRRRPAARRRSA